MRLAVIGGGGREHALAWKVASSDLVDEVVVFPGNPGTATERKVRNVSLPSGGIEEQAAAIAAVSPDLVVIGPEKPLVDGLADTLRATGLAVVGPSAGAAQLEGSKAFAKEVMIEGGVPTAGYRRATTLEEALTAIDSFDSPPVVKADGLAAGKGVVVAATFEEARETVRDFMVGRAFGAAGECVVLEERLIGVEASYIVLTDGHRFVPLTSSQDHKRLLDGDDGPNTGGMGAFSPTPHLSAELEEHVQHAVIEPTLAVLRARGLDFRGFLYAGLMLTDAGPKVLEFNVRSGDPETQAVLFGLKDDLVPILAEVARGELSPRRLSFDPAATIVVASEGYPAKPITGRAITGINAANGDGVRVFHAGTRRAEGELLTAGGRVLAVTSRGDTLAKALARGYQAVNQIHFDGAQFRRDIGRSLSGS